MDFDPLLLFTPPPPRSKIEQVQIQELQILPSESSKESPGDSYTDDEEASEFLPLHVHDLPLLQLKPPSCVLQLFLKLLAPETVRNFAPTNSVDEGKSPEAIFSDKNVTELVKPSLEWLEVTSPRFGHSSQLASIPLLSESLRRNFPTEFNGWLTRLISTNLAWMSDSESEEIKKYASLRLAENCGRSAQPEFIREIEISHMDNHIMLREPSLTADNLGLKTWGSSFILGSRLAAHKERKYLEGSVLELGAGTGLVGMVACRLGYDTTLTDLKEILPNLIANVQLNEISNCEVEELDWSNPSRFLSAKGNITFETIILSDPLYSSKHPAWIVNMINQFLSRQTSARVLLQLPIRRNFENERANLWKLIEENGFATEEEAFETGFDDFGETTFLFKKLTRKQSLPVDATTSGI